MGGGYHRLGETVPPKMAWHGPAHASPPGPCLQCNSFLLFHSSLGWLGRAGMVLGFIVAGAGSVAALPTWHLGCWNCTPWLPSAPGLRLGAQLELQGWGHSMAGGAWVAWGRGLGLWWGCSGLLQGMVRGRALSRRGGLGASLPLWLVHQLPMGCSPGSETLSRCGVSGYVYTILPLGYPWLAHAS